MHDQHEAGQEQELRWLVKRLGAGDPTGSIEELRKKVETAIRSLEQQAKKPCVHEVEAQERAREDSGYF